MTISASVIRRSTKVHRCDSPDGFNKCGKSRDIVRSEAHLRMYGAAHTGDTPYVVRLHMRCRPEKDEKVDAAIEMWKEAVRRECRERQASKAL